MEASIGAGEFKAQCLQLLNGIAERRETLLITKRGKPIARVIPVEPAQSLFGALRGSVVEECDIVAPIDAEWEAAR
ncbi:MAG: type II toxin-antitoxin system prevent-host-death family antitoxin [Gallionella sp.]